MSDLRKVLKAWECCKNPFNRICEKCPFEKECCHDGIPDFVVAKAIELLKEQKEVEPIKSPDKDDDYTFMCSNCKGELFCGDVLRDNFCPICGRKVKWE